MANSDVAAGASGAQTLRLSAPAASQVEYLTTQIPNWGDSQEWGIWIGVRAQALTASNTRYVWLYANEANLLSATADGYRLAIGDDSGGDELRFERILNGAVAATVITSSGAIVNGLTDIGILVRVTRSNAGVWSLYTSTLPVVNGSGAIATDVPNSANANVSQGSAIDTTFTPSADGYFGVAVLHATGANAIGGTEFDQIYFTATTACSNPTIITQPADQFVCSGGQAQFTVATSAASPSFQWRKNGENLDESAHYSGVTATTLTVNLVDNTDLVTSLNGFDCVVSVSGGCSTTSARRALTVEPLPNSTIATADTVCPNSAGNLASVPISAGGAYAWTISGGTIETGSGTDTIGFTAGDSGSVLLGCTVTSSAGCSSNASSTTVTISVEVATIAGNTGPYCTGDTIQLSAAGGAGDTYSWTGPNGFSSPLQNPTLAGATPAMAGDYSVTRTTACGVSPASLTSVSVQTPPDATIATVSPVCAGTTGNSASVLDAGPGAMYAWTITNGTITGGAGTLAITYTAGANPMGLGCTVTVGAACSSVGATSVLIFSGGIPYPMASGNYLEDFTDILNWSDGFGCGTGANHWQGVAIGGSASIPDPTHTTTSTATFVTTSGSGGVQRGGLAGSANPPGTIVLLVTGTVDNSSATAVDLALDFSGRIAGTFSFDWAEVNNNSGNRTASLRVYTSTDGATWAELAGAAVLNLSNNIAASGSITAVALPSALDDQATAKIRFYVCNGTGGSTGSRPKIALDNLSVTSCALPVTPAPSNSGPACSGSTLSLFANTVADSYSWTGPDGFTSSAPNPTIPAASTAAGGDYTLVVTVGGCASPAGTTTVEITPLPAVSVNSATICPGSSAILTAITDASNPSYTWSPGGATTAAITVAPTTTTIYAVMVTDGNTACGNSAAGTVTVNPVPAVTITPATTNVECAGSVTFIADASATGPLTYQWFDNLTNALAGETNLTLTLSNLHDSAAGNYTLVVAGPDCSAVAVATLIVVDTTAPNLVLNGANPATNECHAAYADAGVSASDACVGGVNVSVANDVNPDVTGHYTVRYTADDGNGNTNTAVRTVYIVDSQAPVLTVLGMNPTTNECHMIYVDAGATATDACAGTVSVSTNNPVDANAPGVYTVTYTADDGNGNTNTASRTVYVVDAVAPTITVLGANPYTNYSKVPFVDPGATATDACDASVTVTINGTVDVTTPGSYTLDYVSTDASGNSATNSRNVVVIALESPTIASGQKLADGSFELSFTGPNGQPYQLLTTTDTSLALASWTVLSSGVFGDSPVTYTDNSATNDPVRFYRIASP